MTAISSTEVYAAPSQQPPEETLTYETSGIFSARGRLGAVKYMAQSTLLMVATGILLGLVFYASGFDPDSGTMPRSVTLLMVATGGILITYAWIGCVMFIKRLHDVNLSGWFLLGTLIPVLGMFWAFFIMCAPGMVGDNRFGGMSQTYLWEKIIGITGLILMGLSLLLGMFAVIASLIGF